MTKENLKQTMYFFLTALAITFAVVAVVEIAYAQEYYYDMSDELDYEMETLLESLEYGEEVAEPDDRELSTDKKAPAPFEDSNIKRKLKNGKTQEFDGNKYMIVRRGDRKKVTEKTEVIKTIVKTKPRPKNSLSLYVGYGPNDLKTNETNDKVILDKDFMIGIGYRRQLPGKLDRFHVEGIILTNETGMVGGGYSW